MGRRGGFGGMTALRAALGAVAGGLEGAQQAEALRRKQKLEEENAAFSRASVLSSLGLRPTMVRDTEDPAARNVASLEQPSFAPRGSSSALASALQQGMGVDTSARSLSKPTTMSTANPLTTALDTATTRMKDFERQQSSLPANPAMQMQLPGVGRIGFRGPETPEEKAEQARVLRQEVAKEEAQKASAAAQAKSVDMAAMKSAWMAAGLPDAEADVAARTGAKYGDVYMSDKDLQSLGISRAQLKLAQDRFGFDQKKSAGETPRGEMMNGLQAMGKARAATALNLLETNTKIMKQFEDDLRDGKLQMTGVQVEAARKALAGTPGSAIAEEALNKGNFLIDKNPALLRYIRAGKSIASAVREITPRGGSNLMMQMEIALSGIGPGGTDPESLAQVDAFRNDLLMGVRTGVEAMTGKPSGGTEGGGTANRGSKPAMTIDEWMDANQQGSNESDVAYIARGKAATGGK